MHAAYFEAIRLALSRLNRIANLLSIEGARTSLPLKSKDYGGQMSLSFEQLIENHMSQLDVEYIDSFRSMFAEVKDKEFAKLERDQADHAQMTFVNKDHQQLHQSIIEDEAMYYFGVSDLVDELSILALYKRIELKHNDLVKFFHYSDKGIYRWAKLKEALPDEVQSIPEFDAVNELRLLNNAIKHQGCVSDELVKYYPSYGKRGDEFTELDITYERLKPAVCIYVNRLYTLLKSKK